MRDWQFKSVAVGAEPKLINAAGKFGFTAYNGDNVTLGKGVSAIQDVAANSEIVSKMSPVGQCAVVSGMRAINQLAAGDWVGATTTLAASIIAGAGYLTAKAVAEGAVSSVTLTASDLASGLGALVPMLGVWIDAMATYSGTATAKTPDQILANCRSWFGTVKWGTAPDGKVLPTDIFMAPLVGDSYKGGAYSAQRFYEDDGLRLYQNKPIGLGGYGTGLAEVLIAIESAPTIAGRPKKLWPGMGLTPAEKKAVKNLRLAMSAAYQRPGFVRAYMANNDLKGPYSASAQETDGGYALWPIYADIFWQAWLSGRLPSSYITYLVARRQNKSADVLLDTYQMALGPGRSAVQYDKSGKAFGVAKAIAMPIWLGQSDTGKTIPCVTMDDRAIIQFYAMVTGWDQFVDSHYIDIPGLQAPNNPLHGTNGGVKFPPILVKRQNSDLIVIAAMALGASYYYKKPAGVASAIDSTISKIRRSF